jgi:DNA mismatch endonuclease (patch repair protein)
VPATRTEFWKAKISANQERDARVVTELKGLGWRVAVVWECALRKYPEQSLARLEKFILSSQAYLEISETLTSEERNRQRPQSDEPSKAEPHSRPA